MIVGIDLGTTNSLIGAIDSGFPILFSSERGSRLTPSVVYLPESGPPVVGERAREMREAFPGETISSVKRLIGLRVEEAVDAFPFAIAGRRGEPARVRIRGRDYSPEEISSLILGALKADAERALGGAVDRAVITVPAYFNDAQRNATKTAGELAGFHVERILSEPTAAALAYGLDRLGEKSKVAVFDLGGGTFDISILELHEGIFHVLATHGDTHLGGDDFDAAISGFLNAKTGRSSSRAEAEALKKRLTEQDEVIFSGAPVFRSGIEAACLPILEKTRAHCMRSLADAKLDPGDLDEIILVGGATRMPLVRSFVAGMFGREPNTDQHPDEAVALGAVIQAGILDSTVQNMTLLDVTPLSLGIETFGGLMNIIIPRNTTIPIKRGEMFTNAASGQQSMRIRILQGEREMARDNWQLGECTISFTPAPRGQARVGVQFEIDANGILHVLARDIASGRDAIVEIESGVNPSDEAVEKMLEDSLEHAFEDMDERAFTEAKLKAGEMLPAVAAALDQLGAEVSEDSRRMIQQLVSAVEQAMASRHTSKLKACLARLDEATEPLAVLLVEKAVK